MKKNIYKTKFIDSVVQVFYTFTDFLFVNYWQMSVELSNYNCGFIIVNLP